MSELYPRALYLCRRASDGKIIALRRHGHHQKGEYMGHILTSEATPILFEGVEYVPKPSNGDTRPIYTCHRLATLVALADDADSYFEEAFGLKIEEMG